MANTQKKSLADGILPLPCLQERTPKKYAGAAIDLAQGPIPLLAAALQCSITLPRPKKICDGSGADLRQAAPAKTSRLRGAINLTDSPAEVCPPSERGG